MGMFRAVLLYNRILMLLILTESREAPASGETIAGPLASIHL